MGRHDGTCYRCGGSVHRKTAGGKWYLLCDECRATEPEDDQDSEVQELELERRKAELARAEVVGGEAPPEVQHSEDVRQAAIEAERRAKERLRIDYTNPDRRNPTYKSDFPGPANPLTDSLGPTGFDDKF
jgi:hypothetical protein